MTCDVCKKDNFRLRNVKPSTWACFECASLYEPSKPQNSIHIEETVNFKYYRFNGGNVSRARVEALKRRVMHPEGNGEVVVRDHSGKITDHLARA